MVAEIGAPAPEFTLIDQDRNSVSLTSLSGRKTLIVFIPFPFTRTCEGELCTIRDHRTALTDLGANVVAITCDTMPSNKRWSDDNGFGFPVLSDFWPHGETAKAYGAFNEMVGVANRYTFVLDEDGVVREIIHTDSLGTAREFDAYKSALSSL